MPPQTVDTVRPAYDDITRLYGSRMLESHQPQQSQQPRRPMPKFRMSGGSSGLSGAGSSNNAAAMGAAAITFGNTGINANNILTPQRGSFQRLKELVWTERAKELQQQRKNEEMAVRAAILKDLTNGQQ